MKRKILSLVLVMMLLSVSALAAVKLNSSLIDDAKQALNLMSYGEYKKALKKLDFSKNEPSASELGDFVYSSLDDLAYVSVQSDIAVAYRLKSGWRIAVPIEEPSYDTVQTLVLRSKNGQSFDNYKAMSWYEVENEMGKADKVVWQDAYDPGDIYLATDQY